MIVDDRGPGIDLQRQGYERLAANILNQCYKDYYHCSDWLEFWEVLYWMIGDQAKLYRQFLQLDYNPLRPICDSKTRVLLKNKRRKFKIRK